MASTSNSTTTTSIAKAMANSSPEAIAEVEETMARISSHKGVEGILIMTEEGAIIQSTLTEEQSTTHAALLCQLASKASFFVNTIDPNDEMTFLRIRSKNREVMIAPDKEYFMVVIQNPNVV